MQTAFAKALLGTVSLLPNDRYVLLPVDRSSHHGRVRGVHSHRSINQRFRRRRGESAAILRSQVRNLNVIIYLNYFRPVFKSEFRVGKV